MRFSLVFCGLVTLAALLVGCATRPEPISAVDAAGLGRRCPEGTFMGAMTLNCPQVVK